MARDVASQPMYDVLEETAPVKPDQSRGGDAHSSSLEPVDNSVQKSDTGAISTDNVINTSRRRRQPDRFQAR